MGLEDSGRAVVQAGPLPMRNAGRRGLARTRALAAVGAAAVAVLGVAGIAGPQSRAADAVTGARPGPPAAVVAAARSLLWAVEPDYSVTGPAEWVRTTRRAYERLAGYREPGPDEDLYVVQVRGRFTCAACLRPYGAKAPTGSATTTAFPVDGQGETSGGVGPPADLSRLGTVHTFPIS